MPEADDDRRTDGVTLFPGTAALTNAAVDAAGIDGAAVAILTDTAAARDLLHATDCAAVRIDELQFTIGQGPCLQAFRSGKPIAIADLADDSRTSQWPPSPQRLWTNSMSTRSWPAPSPRMVRPSGCWSCIAALQAHSQVRRSRQHYRLPLHSGPRCWPNCRSTTGTSTSPDTVRLRAASGSRAQM